MLQKLIQGDKIHEETSPNIALAMKEIEHKCEQVATQNKLLRDQLIKQKETIETERKELDAKEKELSERENEMRHWSAQFKTQRRKWNESCTVTGELFISKFAL